MGTNRKSIISIKQIGFIGAGNMAHALIAGMIKSGIPSQKIFVTDIDQSKLKKMRDQFKIKSSSLQEVFKNCSTIVLAIKPQNFPDLLTIIVPYIQNHLLISIAAGIETASLKKFCKKIVRAMPNNPALIGEGITALFSSQRLRSQDLKTVEIIFKGSGKILWVRKESELDGVTGLSGSGPAYLYRFVKALSHAGEKVGLKKSDAYELALQTVLGAALTLHETKKNPDELIPLVTSKGGTTFAGLKILDQKKFDKIIEETVKAATKRARELKKAFSFQPSAFSSK